MNEGIFDRIKHSEIYLFGVSDTTGDVYQRYKEKLNIKACVTNYEDMKKKRMFDNMGLETILLEEYRHSDGKYLIVCDEQLYDYYTCFMKVANEALDYYGLSEYEDYVSYKALELMEGDKYLVLMQGSLLCGQVYEKLRFQESMSEYAFIYYDEDNIFNVYRDDFKEYLHMSRFADVYIYSVSDKEKSASKKLECKGFRTECKSIGISDYCFKALYPQIKEGREIYSTYLLRKRERLGENYGRFFAAREDNNLVEMVLGGMQDKDIISSLCSDDFYSEQYLQQHYEECIAAVQKADIKSDIKLEEYITDKIGKIILNVNLDEYNEELVDYVCERIMNSLGKDYKKDIRHTAWGTELVIYPCVAKFYGLSEKVKDKKYRIYTYSGTQSLGLEEYLEYYIKCVKAAMAIYEIVQIRKFRKENLLGLWLQPKMVFTPRRLLYNKGNDKVDYFGLGNNSFRIATKLSDDGIEGENVLAVLSLKSQRLVSFWGTALSNNCFLAIDKPDREKILKMVSLYKPAVIVTSRAFYDKVRSICEGINIIGLFDCQSITTNYDRILDTVPRYHDDLPVYRDVEWNAEDDMVVNDYHYKEIVEKLDKIQEIIK